MSAPVETSIRLLWRVAVRTDHRIFDARANLALADIRCIPSRPVGSRPLAMFLFRLLQEGGQALNGRCIDWGTTLCRSSAVRSLLSIVMAPSSPKAEKASE
jgi:hypothetical protein